jgi:hypothetical protein
MSRIRFTEDEIHKINMWSFSVDTIEDLPNSFSLASRYRWVKRLKEDFEPKLNGRDENGQSQYDLYYKKKWVVPPSKREQVLTKEYDAPMGWIPFFDKIKKKYINISQDDIQSFLNRLEVKQLTKPTQSIPQIKPVLSDASHKHYQIDLIDIRSLGRKNSGYKYILNCVDIFSKYGQSEALKTKTEGEVIEALKRIFERMGKPRILQSDNGGEFKNKVMDAYGEEEDFKIIHSQPYRSTSQGQVERWNRTIRNKLNSLMTENQTTRWVDYLPDVVKRYNDTIHSSTQEKPYVLHNTKNEKLIDEVEQRLRERAKKAVMNTDHLEPLSKGDIVRRAMSSYPINRRNKWTKTGVNWSKETFIVKTKLASGLAFQKANYKISSMDGQDVPLVFRRGELLKIEGKIIPMKEVEKPTRVVGGGTRQVKLPTKTAIVERQEEGTVREAVRKVEEDKQLEPEYIVEKIVEHKGKTKSNLKFLVKWAGYPDSENTWESYRNMSETSALEKYLAEHPEIKLKSR